MGTVGVLGVCALVAACALVVRAALTHTSHRAAFVHALRTPLTWIVGVPIVVVGLLVGGPYAYLQIATGRPAKPLTFDQLRNHRQAAASSAAAIGSTQATAAGPSTSTTAAGSTAAGASRSRLAAARADVPASPIAGTWRVGDGTQAGYSADDNAMGQTSRVVGRTSKVTGTMQIVDRTVAAVQVIVDMQSVTCHCVHDAKYQQLLETGKYPTSTFRLTTPIAIGIPPANDVIDVQVTGDFTIHGITHSQTFSLKATRIAQRIAVNGSIPVNLKDYDIQGTSNQFGSVSNVTIDLLVAFDPA